MNESNHVLLLNDSFPPLIDGVANAVSNYARNLPQNGYTPIVITPNHPDADDSGYPYDIIRYPSIDLTEKTGYYAGIPFSPEIANRIKGKKISVIHSHCPVVSTFMARELRQITDAPIVITYHTKFDIDISTIIRSKRIQSGSIRALVSNISACDEVWAVSQGAADNLHSLGYEGPCIVMPNGVDLPKGKVSQEEISAVVKEYDLPLGIPVFLFVGRIRWYKGLKIILDALAKLKQSSIPFRMVFVGNGSDLCEVQAYSDSMGLGKCCIFTGAIQGRQALRAWYSRADLFLFPSTFDTNGLVVREAAACSLAAVMIANSCASEGVTDNRNGFLIQENADSLFHCLKSLYDNPLKMKQVGENAANELYMSWETSVAKAAERYQIVDDYYRSGKYPSRHRPLEEVFRANGELMEELSNIQTVRKDITERITEQMEYLRSLID